ncbi:MAG: hypothetical protein ABSB63_16065 [Spirochaetia bacterium]|jgi:hypothetical protein
MTIHFHIGPIPIMFTITKGPDLVQEIHEKTEALLFYALRYSEEGARARYTLRKWAGARHD